jgi:hypothetical protein
MSNDLRLNDGEFAPLAKAKAWRIVAEADAGLRIKLLADFANEKDATDSKAALQLIGEKLTALMPFYKENMIPFLNQQQAEHPGAGELATKMTGAIDAASQALKAMEVRSRGNLAGAQIFIKTEEPLTTAVLLLTLTPRAGVE